LKSFIGYTLAFSLLALGLIASGPTGTYAQGHSLPQEMIGVTWELAVIERGMQSAEDLRGVGITLVFIDGSKIGGKGGCNSFFGEYSTGAGQSLTFSGIGSTLIGCEEPIASREVRYFGALQGVTSYTLSGDRLDLAFSDDSGQGTLRYVKGASQPPMPSDPPQTPGMPRTGEGGIVGMLALVTASAIFAGLLVRRFARKSAS